MNDDDDDDDIRVSRYPDIQISRYPDIQMSRCPDVQMSRCPDVQAFGGTSPPGKAPLPEIQEYQQGKPLVYQGKPQSTRKRNLTMHPVVGGPEYTAPAVCWIWGAQPFLNWENQANPRCIFARTPRNGVCTWNCVRSFASCKWCHRQGSQR